MTSISDLKGFSLPLTPGGTSSVVGDMPWHYGTEYLTILYRTAPGAIARYLPKPLEPGPDCLPGGQCRAFGADGRSANRRAAVMLHEEAPSITHLNLAVNAA